MNEIKLHRLNECYDCKKFLEKDIVIHGYFSKYLNRLVCFCDQCYKIREAEKFKKIKDRQKSNTVKGRLVEKLTYDKQQSKLVQYFK